MTKGTNLDLLCLGLKSRICKYCCINFFTLFLTCGYLCHFHCSSNCFLINMCIVVLTNSCRCACITLICLRPLVRCFSIQMTKGTNLDRLCLCLKSRICEYGCISLFTLLFTSRSLCHLYSSFYCLCCCIRIDITNC